MILTASIKRLLQDFGHAHAHARARTGEGAAGSAVVADEGESIALGAKETEQKTD